MEGLTLISDHEEVSVFRYKIENLRIILLLDKVSNILYMSANDMRQILGYKNEVAMLGSDLALDICSRVKQATGKYPVQGNFVSTSLLRKLPIKE